MTYGNENHKKATPNQTSWVLKRHIQKHLWTFYIFVLKTWADWSSMDQSWKSVNFVIDKTFTEATQGYYGFIYTDLIWQIFAKIDPQAHNLQTQPVSFISSLNTREWKQKRDNKKTHFAKLNEALVYVCFPDWLTKVVHRTHQSHRCH